MPRFRTLLDRLGTDVLRTDLRYLLYSGFWGNLATVSVSAFSLLLYYVFATYLPKETYGTYQYLLALAVLIGSFTLTGMNTAVIRAVSRGYEGTLRGAVLVQLKYAYLPFALGILGAVWYLLNGNLLLAVGLLMIGACTPLANAFNTHAAYLIGKKDFRGSFLFNLLFNVPFYSALIAVALLSDDPLVLLAANLVVQVIGYFLCYRAVLALYKPNRDEDPEAARYGTHLSVMGVLGTFVTQLDAILVFHFLGPVQLAIYSFATAIPDRLGGLLKFLPMAALPRFAARDEEVVRHGIRARIGIVLGLVLLVSLLYAWAAPYIYAFLFPAYAIAAPYSQWYSIVLIAVLTQVVLAGLSAHERVKELYLFNTLMPLIQAGLMIAGVLLYGLAGLIGARVAVAVLSLATALWLYRPRR